MLKDNEGLSCCHQVTLKHASYHRFWAQYETCGEIFYTYLEQWQFVWQFDKA